ncbi:MAG TPA: hypothetical protein VMF30_15845 [Pirellulales bacterium]|nr:hypothetical protein [Pirellulales bacterium]
MIAPLRQPPVKHRRRSALSAARHAVAEALLDSDDRQSRWRQALVRWRNWLIAAALLAAAALYFLSISWFFDAT